MKKIVFCLLLLTFSFRLAAQIDYLEPVKPFSTYTGELGEYYRTTRAEPTSFATLSTFNTIL